MDISNLAFYLPNKTENTDKTLINTPSIDKLKQTKHITPKDIDKELEQAQKTIWQNHVKSELLFIADEILKLNSLAHLNALNIDYTKGDIRVNEFNKINEPNFNKQTKELPFGSFNDKAIGGKNYSNFVESYPELKSLSYFNKDTDTSFYYNYGNSNSFSLVSTTTTDIDGKEKYILKAVKNTNSYFTSTLTNVLQSDAYKNLTDEAKSDTLTTRHGNGKLFLDLYNDNDKLGIGKFSSVAMLFSFDSNKDGYINGDDELFHKIKVRGYDKDGNEMIMSLSEFTDGFGIDLTKFINKNIINHTEKRINEHNEKAKISPLTYKYVDTSKIDNRITYYSSNPYTAFAPDLRYKKLDNDTLKSFFDANADADGWVSLKNNNVFNKENGLNNFAYEKFGFDGKLRLSEFRPIVEEQLFDGKLNYGKFQKERFMKFYEDYQKEGKTHAKNIEWLSENLKKYGAENADKLIANLKDSKSAYMIAMQNEFKNATGLDFSERNLKKVMLAFRKDTQRAAAALADSDSVIAMKRNGDNSYTLRFDSGREIVVSAIYSDTGKLIANNKGLSGLVKLKAQSLDEISLRKLEFSSTAIKDAEGKFKTLKEIGTKFIDIISNEQGTQFLITLQDGSTINEKDLYNISFLKNTLEHKNGFLRDDKNSQDKTKKMYQKVDRLV